MDRTRLTHRICALLIACWIPFCCCTLKAAMVMANGSEFDGGQMMSCCCSSQDTCTENSGEEPAPAQEGPCTDCCLKVSPDAPTTPNLSIDEIGRELPSIEAVTTIRSHHPGTGLTHPQLTPPDPPPGDLVTLRCKLLV